MSSLCCAADHRSRKQSKKGSGRLFVNDDSDSEGDEEEEDGGEEEDLYVPPPRKAVDPRVSKTSLAQLAREIDDYDRQLDEQAEDRERKKLSKKELKELEDFEESESKDSDYRGSEDEADDEEEEEEGEQENDIVDEEDGEENEDDGENSLQYSPDERKGVDSLGVKEVQAELKKDIEANGEDDSRIIRLIEFISAFDDSCAEAAPRSVSNPLGWRTWKAAVQKVKFGNSNEAEDSLWSSQSQPHHSHAHTRTVHLTLSLSSPLLISAVAIVRITVYVCATVFVMMWLQKHHYIPGRKTNSKWATQHCADGCHHRFYYDRVINWADALPKAQWIGMGNTSIHGHSTAKTYSFLTPHAHRTTSVCCCCDGHCRNSDEGRGPIKACSRTGENSQIPQAEASSSHLSDHSPNCEDARYLQRSRDAPRAAWDGETARGCKRG